MKCPKCGELGVSVTKTCRLERDGAKRRYRKCSKCGHRFSTIEEFAPEAGCKPGSAPLSAEALDARRLPHPTLLLQAEQDRLDIPTKPRVARAVRVPRGVA